VNFTFSGNRALILGGTCDLAFALAGSMIERNLFPILTYRDEKGLSTISNAMQSFEGKYEAYYLNFSDRSSLGLLFTYIGDGLDCLIDFAQGNYESLVASADEDTVYRYFTENISFRAEVLKAAGRIMIKKRRGRLSFISSTAALRPNPGPGFYAAAKLASEALYRYGTGAWGARRTAVI